MVRSSYMLQRKYAILVNCFLR